MFPRSIEEWKTLIEINYFANKKVKNLIYSYENVLQQISNHQFHFQSKHVQYSDFLINFFLTSEIN